MTARTLVLVAFPPEWDALVAHIADPAEHRINGRTVLTGALAGAPVVLAETGVSMVNAAMTTQALVDRFPVARIVASGIAGGIDPALTVGDVVAPERWGQFLEIGMGRAEGEGWSLPPLPGATDRPPYGMMIPRDVLACRAGEPIAAHRWFAADPALLDVARGLVADGARAIVGGTGISGTAFVDNADYRRYLFATFGASVVDMESAAVAQVAFANSLPFIVFRSLSDLAGGEHDANRFPDFMAHAADRSAAVVRAFLEAIGPC